MSKKFKQKKKCLKTNFWIFLWALFLLLLALNFVGKELFGITHFWWHISLHMGIMILCFFVIMDSLKLNEKPSKLIIFGCIILLLEESIFILTHIFNEYYWLETHLIPRIFGIVAIFILMYGFKEATK